LFGGTNALNVIHYALRCECKTNCALCLQNLETQMLVLRN